jgi:excisionase family DNA binding protein
LKSDTNAWAEEIDRLEPVFRRMVRQVLEEEMAGLSSTIRSRPVPDGTPLLLKPAQAAEMLALPKSRIYGLLAAGTIRSFRLGRSIRVERGELNRFVSDHAEGGAR